MPAQTKPNAMHKSKEESVAYAMATGDCVWSREET